MTDANKAFSPHGETLFGDTVAGAHTSKLGDTFLIPPFTVLNAREGWWQERKRAWLALGIQSELGRGGGLLNLSESIDEYRNNKNEYLARIGRGPLAGKT